MQYTLILTETAEGGIQVTIPALPACTVEAATRDEAIRLAREAIAQLVSHSEIVQIDILQQPRTTVQPQGVPWEWFGEAKADPYGMPSSMTSSSAVRPPGTGTSAYVSVGCEHPSCFWPRACHLTLVSVAGAVGRDLAPVRGGR